PALLRAGKVARRAARIGFDWPDARAVLPKIAEELAEVERELEDGDKARLEDEIGDLLYAVANLARKLDIEPETALRRATAKFERRFRRLEALATERGVGPDIDDLKSCGMRSRERRKSGRKNRRNRPSMHPLPVP